MIDVNSRDIKVLHLEPTDVCQAACPQCFREIDVEFNKNEKNNLTIDQLDRILPTGFIENLDKMFMCGVYGDPAANHQSLAIYRWFRQQNPNITLGMNTNGALQNTFWWHELAQILNQPRDYVVFSIDGLEDTNGDYRVNVNWSKLMQNVRAFIAGGGKAHWDMLVFRHNEHQVDQCESLAREMGFQWFRAKISRRPMTGRLEIPIRWQYPHTQRTDIQCHALKEQSIYIDARGRVFPCCWLSNRTKDSIVDFDAIQESWISPEPNHICVSSCGSDIKGSDFSKQWRREIEFNHV